jgi:hypothetical protein
MERLLVNCLRHLPEVSVPDVIYHEFDSLLVFDADGRIWVLLDDVVVELEDVLHSWIPEFVLVIAH